MIYLVRYVICFLGLGLSVIPGVCLASELSDTYARLEKVQNLAMPLQETSVKIYQVYEDFYRVNGGDSEQPLSQTLVIHVMSDTRLFFSQFDEAKKSAVDLASPGKSVSCAASMEKIESKIAKDLRIKSQDKEEMAMAMKNELPMKYMVLSQAFSTQAHGSSCF